MYMHKRLISIQHYDYSTYQLQKITKFLCDYCEESFIYKSLQTQRVYVP